MKLITDEKLHLFILNPEELDKETLQEIQKQSETSEEIWERINKIEKFHAEYNRLKEINPEYVSLQAMLFPEENNINHTKLAASTEIKKDEYKYVKTFASAKSLVLVRLMYNSVQDNYLLYLISDNMDDVAEAKVKFPELNIEATADREGIVHLSGINFEGVNNILVESKNENL